MRVITKSNITSKSELETKETLGQTSFISQFEPFEDAPESLDDMLKEIKNIMLEDMNIETDKIKDQVGANDVLELSASEMIEEGKNKTEEITESNDVLKNIDNILGGNKEDKKTTLEKVESKLDDILGSVPNEVKEETKEAGKIVESPKIVIPVAENTDQKKDQENKDEPKIQEEVKVSSAKLVSEESAQKSVEVIKTFMKKIEKPVSDGLSFRSGTTVEQLIVEILKPKLSEWLDNNLSNIVSRIVEKEVRKLIPKDDD